MLVHSLKVVFVHVPKTGGQSVEHALLERLGESWETRSKYLLLPNDDPRIGPPRMAHLTMMEYRDLGHVTQNQYDNYFKFGFVRNPWARLTSEYRFRRSSIRTSFRTWLLERFPEPGFDDMWRHVMPQSHFLYNSRGRQEVDYIGRFESLAKDYSIVSDRIEGGLPALRRINSSTNNSAMEQIVHAGLVRGLRDVILKSVRMAKHTTPARWQDYYDDETREFVTRFYAEDIERFGYEFDAPLRDS